LVPPLGGNELQPHTQDDNDNDNDNDNNNKNKIIIIIIIIIINLTSWGYKHFTVKNWRSCGPL